MAEHTWKPGTVVAMGHGHRVVHGIIDTDGRFYTTDQSMRTVSARDVGALRRLLVIDPEDRRQIQGLLVGFCREACINIGTIVGTDALQSALRAMLVPPTRWTPGDVIQHHEGNFTAQRFEDGWRTTAGNHGRVWSGDEKVTRMVEQGLYVVLREQKAVTS